jgi:hypothetical protein
MRFVMAGHVQVLDGWACRRLGAVEREPLAACGTHKN